MENEDDCISICSSDCGGVSSNEEEEEEVGGVGVGEDAEQHQASWEKNQSGLKNIPTLLRKLRRCDTPIEFGQTLSKHFGGPENQKLLAEIFDGLQKIECKFVILNDRAFAPKRATPGSAGYDLFATETITLEPGEICEVDFGLKIVTPGDYIHCEIKSRSGMACNDRIEVVGSGIIDSDYKQSIVAVLENRSKSKSYRIFRGHRVAQLVFRPYANVKLVQSEEEGEGQCIFHEIPVHICKNRLGQNGQQQGAERCGGFGSTGV